MFVQRSRLAGYDLSALKQNRSYGLVTSIAPNIEWWGTSSKIRSYQHRSLHKCKFHALKGILAFSSPAEHRILLKEVVQRPHQGAKSLHPLPEVRAETHPGPQLSGIPRHRPVLDRRYLGWVQFDPLRRNHMSQEVQLLLSKSTLLWLGIQAIVFQNLQNSANVCHMFSCCAAEYAKVVYVHYTEITVRPQELVHERLKARGPLLKGLRCIAQPKAHDAPAKQAHGGPEAGLVLATPIVLRLIC